MSKLKKSNATFWAIFKHCAILNKDKDNERLLLLLMTRKLATLTKVFFSVWPSAKRFFGSLQKIRKLPIFNHSFFTYFFPNFLFFGEFSIIFIFGTKIFFDTFWNENFEKFNNKVLSKMNFEVRKWVKFTIFLNFCQFLSIWFS